MININEKLLGEVDGNELLTLCHIAKRMNRNGSSFPSMETLRRETGLGRDAMAKVIRSLCAKGMLEKDQKRVKKGTFSSNLYTVTTRHISIFANIHGAKISDEPDTDSPVTEKPATATPDTVEPVTEKQPTKYYSNSLEVLSSFEVLNTHTPGAIDLSETTEIKVAAVHTENPFPLNAKEKRTPPVPAAPPAGNDPDPVKIITDKILSRAAIVDRWKGGLKTKNLKVDAEEFLREEARKAAHGWIKKQVGMTDQEVLSSANRTGAMVFISWFEGSWLPNVDRIGQTIETKPNGTRKPEPPKFKYL